MDEESVKKLITLRSSLPHSIKEIPFLLKQKLLVRAQRVWIEPDGDICQIDVTCNIRNLRSVIDRSHSKPSTNLPGGE